MILNMGNEKMVSFNFNYFINLPNLLALDEQYFYEHY